MRAFSRLLNWTSRLRALIRGQDDALDPSHPDFQAFALDRYAPHQQREIARLIARQPVISRSDIAAAIARAERKVQRSGQLTGLAVGVGFVAIFGLGMVAAQHQPPPAGGADQASAANPPVHLRAEDGHWSPGGLDDADRAFFADLQAGRIATTNAAPQPRPAMAVVTQPAAPQPLVTRQARMIQLGAFADAGVARARWQAMSTQFPVLRPLTLSVSAVASGGRTLYRLRASGVDAASACSVLAGAGATCFVATDAG